MSSTCPARLLAGWAGQCTLPTGLAVHTGRILASGLGGLAGSSAHLATCQSGLARQCCGICTATIKGTYGENLISLCNTHTTCTQGLQGTCNTDVEATKQALEWAVMEVVIYPILNVCIHLYIQWKMHAWKHPCSYQTRQIQRNLNSLHGRYLWRHAYG